MDLDQLLRLMTEKGASDLHLKPKRPPLLRVHGKLMPVEMEPLTPGEIQQMVEKITSPVQKVQLEEKMALDMGYGVAGLSRFRGNIYIQRGTMAAAFRRIPYEVPGYDALGLPDVIDEFTNMNVGLVLVTGPTGSGKSTTLATVLRAVKGRRPVHIITIEDPIEFLFADDVATVSQREIGTDTPSFGAALRNAMRQDPDVIMVGEMRDAETVATVISAAETGHLVFSTLHTNSAAQTIDRILDHFPGNLQNQIRQQLSQVLVGVVSMKLVEKKDGQGLVPALEIMRGSPRISQLIAKGNTKELLEEIEGSVAYYGMQSLNQSLMSLLVHDVITYQEAMHQSPDPEDLSLKLRRMFPQIEERGGDMSAPSDFSQILELMEIRKLYEEQEEKNRLRMGEKDELITSLEHTIGERDQRLGDLQAEMDETTRQREKMKTEYDRLRNEAQEKIDKLGERIRQLNQRLLQAS
jgi:twitching motility protein PilT